MPDVVYPIGGMPIPAEDLSSADQDTVTGDGSTLNPLVARGVVGGGIVVDPNVHATSFNAEAGTLYYVESATPQTVTLPSAADAGNGALVGINVRGAEAAWSVAAAGGDTINLGSPYSIGADDGNYVELISDGISSWNVRSTITPGAVVASGQRFIYITNGTETSAGFAVPLPVNQAPPYFVVAQMEGFPSYGPYMTFDIPEGDQLANQFTVLPSDDLQAGEKIAFYVDALTA